MRYATANIGDDIQSLAARQFLARVDCWADRDRLEQWRGDSSIIAILNGWWTHRPETWPPPQNVRPLLISMHITPSEQIIHAFTAPRLKDYYAQWGPVGCRDTVTLTLLKSAGVPAYFSGCLTLTFPHFAGNRGDTIFVVDLFGEHGTGAVSHDTPWYKNLPSWMHDRLEFRTHYIPSTMPAGERFEYAQSLLASYSRASLVITGRLHCALPCVAFGTPTVFVKPSVCHRLDGLSHLLHVRERIDVREGRWRCDWQRIQSPDWASLNNIRNDLSATCRSFIQRESFMF